ncbi:MAG: alpha/beta hydrolase [Gammaproteobacteria bacterium]|nr:alpha/beta hydrolase [Gammaproteobacteria bacterium]
MASIWKLLLIGVCIYAVMTAFIYFRQSSLIYYPNMPGRTLEVTPEAIGLAYQDVEFLTEDAIKLHGWFVPNESAKGTLLFFHGNAGNISHRLESINLFHKLGLNVFIIDYRGYGQSEGKVSEKGTYRDAEAAWKYLVETRGISTNEIIIFGRSLGASIATWLASKHTPAALIIESGFASVPSMAKRLYPFLPVRWLAVFSYDTKQYVKNISCPVLIAHSRNDDIIPFAEGLEIFDAAPEAKQFLEMRGGHNDGFMVSGLAYIEGLKSFIHENLE